MILVVEDDSIIAEGLEFALTGEGMEVTLASAVALGFAEKDDEIRREQEIETERQRNTDIIEILASEYSSVYYIDLTTDALNPKTERTL